jgi:hypothetical protein
MGKLYLFHDVLYLLSQARIFIFQQLKEGPGAYTKEEASIGYSNEYH